MTKYVAYARVSTDKQGRSGLGLEAQETIIRQHITSDDRILLPIMIEVESGKVRERPVLTAALAKCRLHGASLIVAKLDRLARDSAFVAAVLASGVPVVLCDIPATHGATGTFVIATMANVAQLEAGLISERTRAALQAAKERGKKLGGYRGGPVPDAASGGLAAARKADSHAAMLAPVLAELHGLSLAGIAAELNRRSVVTPRDGQWTATAVRRTLARLTAAA